MRRPCCHLHPGVCAEELSDDIKAAHAAMVQCVAAFPPGAAFRLEAECGDGSVRFFHKVTAYSERGEVVLVECNMAMGHLNMRIDGSGGFAFQMSHRALLDVWAACGAAPESLSILRLDAKEATSWEEACEAWPRYESAAALSVASKQIWPLPAASASSPTVPGRASMDPMQEAIAEMRGGKQGCISRPADEDADDDLEVSDKEDEAAIASLEVSMKAALKKKRRVAARKRAASGRAKWSRCKRPALAAALPGSGGTGASSSSGMPPAAVGAPLAAPAAASSTAASSSGAGAASGPLAPAALVREPKEPPLPSPPFPRPALPRLSPSLPSPPLPSPPFPSPPSPCGAFLCVALEFALGGFAVARWCVVLCVLDVVLVCVRVRYGE